tara:strand:+ start:2951 stop:3607 length:657 start_codon:yes stop_codon:yes gene_type:complete
MSTFLELCQDLRQEAGFTGSGPTSVINQAGQYAKIVTWVNRAYLEILTQREDWDFMWGTTTFNTVASQNYYVSTDDVATWGNAAIYDVSLTKTDETPIDFIQYVDFFEEYLIGVPLTGRPKYFTIRPDGAVLLYPTPDKVYTFTANYYKQAKKMVANTEVPSLPSQYHPLILYKALAHCTANTEDFNTYQYAERQVDLIMNKLERDQCCAIDTAGPLA